MIVDCHGRRSPWKFPDICGTEVTAVGIFTHRPRFGHRLSALIRAADHQANANAAQPPERIPMLLWHELCIR